MTIRLAAGTDSFSAGSITAPDNVWSMVCVFSPSGNKFSYNHFLSNGNAGASVPNTLNLLWDTNLDLALNVFAGAVDIDSSLLTSHRLVADDYYALMIKRVAGNLLQMWKIDMDAAGNSAPVKIYEVDCTGIGSFTMTDFYVGQRDGAYTDLGARADVLCWGFAPEDISTSDLNQLALGSTLTSLSAVFDVGYEFTSTSGSVTVIDDISTNDQDGTINGTLSYAANPTYAAQSNLGWVSPQLLDSSNLPIADASDWEVNFRLTAASASILSLSNQSSVSGVITIDSDAIGNLGDPINVYLSSASSAVGGVNIAYLNAPVVDINA